MCVCVCVCVCTCACVCVCVYAHGVRACMYAEHYLRYVFTSYEMVAQCSHVA